MLLMYVLRRQPKLFCRICGVKSQHFAFMSGAGIGRFITLRTRTKTPKATLTTIGQGMRERSQHFKKAGMYKLLVGMIKRQHFRCLIITENHVLFH